MVKSREVLPMQGFVIAACIVAALFAAAFAVTMIKLCRVSSASKPNESDGKDSSTGLYLRDRFLTEAQRELKAASASGKSAALIIFDVDGLGKINTLFGNSVGDGVVSCFAKSVINASAGKFPCGRVDTDDFAVLMTYDDENAPDMFIQSFREELDRTYADATLLKRADFYAGVVVYDGCDDIYTMFSKANLCLMTKDGGRITYFVREMEERILETELLRAEMLSALDNGEFELYYQPKISFKTGEIIGVESLIRWHHPTKGFIPPSEFIPLAEQTGIITQIDEWGLRTACKQCKQWLDEGLPPVKISVNMSQAQFYCTDVIGTVTEVLAETGLDPKQLEIEVTETMAMQDIERTINVLGYIRSMGVSISMDDFGSGYSSLSSLKTIPLDTLKIDRSLVCDLDENNVSKQITGAIVDLGKAMKLIILAEGVETVEQSLFLTEIGCDLAQGFYFSKPCPASEIRTLLLMPHYELKKQISK